MLRSLAFVLSVAIPFAAVEAQAGTLNLAAGQSVHDSQATQVSVSNAATGGGIVKVHYNGTIVDGNIVGAVTSIDNPGSGGSKGPITVDTGGHAITINLASNGTKTGSATTTVDGGNATINVNSNFNNLTVGGTNNQVNINGSNNVGDGKNASSSGVVEIAHGTSNNTWNGTGNFTVHNN